VAEAETTVLESLCSDKKGRIKMDKKEKNDFEKGRDLARGFAAAVYAGVVVAATTLFISFVLTAFPADAYFSRFIMGVGGLLVGGSMIAFPVALHNWAISGTHRKVTVALYYGEMAIIALNTIVSFAVLLSKNDIAMVIPQWVWLYEPFSIVAIVYTLGAWGTVFLLDPAAQAKAKEKEADQNFEKKVSDKLIEFLDSIEGEDAILTAAKSKIEERYGAQNFDTSKKHFGSGRNTGIPVEMPSVVRREADTEQAKLADPTEPSRQK
jgi:hypothetical protein